MRLVMVTEELTKIHPHPTKSNKDCNTVGGLIPTRGSGSGQQPYASTSAAVGLSKWIWRGIENPTVVRFDTLPQPAAGRAYSPCMNQSLADKSMVSPPVISIKPYSAHNFDQVISFSPAVLALIIL